MAEAGVAATQITSRNRRTQKTAKASQPRKRRLKAKQQSRQSDKLPPKVQTMTGQLGGQMMPGSKVGTMRHGTHGPNGPGTAQLFGTQRAAAASCSKQATQKNVPQPSPTLMPSSRQLPKGANAPVRQKTLQRTSHQQRKRRKQRAARRTTM